MESRFDGLALEERESYEADPSYARFIRKVVIAWSKPDLIEEIGYLQAGRSLATRTINNVEVFGKGADRSRRRILAALNMGLSDRRLPTVGYAEVFPPEEINSETFSPPQPIGIVFDPSTVSSKRVPEFIDLLVAAFGVELEIVRASPLSPTPQDQRKVA